jgi:2-oxoisovalerate dehydrogenase E1 component
MTPDSAAATAAETLPTAGVAHDLLDCFASELAMALRIRRTEQKLLQLFAEGKLFGTVHTCIGQEFVAVAVSRALEPHDIVFSNHRGHGHFLATGGTVVELIAEVMGKAAGICRGRGGSQHLQKGRYFSNGIQGGIVPVTAGLAGAQKMLATGAIAVVFIGDGTLGEGALYETLNIASKWELPLLIVCENNLFAQSTSQEQTLAGDICARAEAFGIKTRHSNTYEWMQLFSDMERSIAEVRSSCKPLFHRVDTFRLMAHSKGDDNRPSEYVQAHWARDPLTVLEAALKDDPRWAAAADAIAAEIAGAAAVAEESDFADAAVPMPKQDSVAWTPLAFEPQKVVAAVRRGLEQALARSDRVILIGEDIESPYGGAFKCTAELSAKFPGRVRNTPISELAIVGIGNGFALGGMLPVVEIMFGDFVTLAIDQWVNHAGKFAYMFADKVTVPLVVRTPMGGKRGYGATHSQSLERLLVGVPGTQVLCLHHRYPADRLYDSLFAMIDRPTMVVENKLLYGRTASATPPAGYELFANMDQFPTVRLRPAVEPAMTIVAIGAMSLDVEEALATLFDEDEVTADVFLPTRLYPFDASCLLDSLRATRRLLVVEEGQGFAGLGAEIIAQAIGQLGPTAIACDRVCAAPVPIPAARPLEAECLPGATAILARARALLATGD